MIKCNRCKRELKSDESIKLGYGKRCHEITFGKIDKKKKQIKGYF